MTDPLHPGELVKMLLDRRHWMQKDFAEILDRPMQFVSEVINGKKEITRESAAQIGAALGWEPLAILELQDRYHLWLLEVDEAHQRKLAEIRQRVKERNEVP